MRSELRSEFVVLLTDRKFKDDLAQSRNEFPLKLVHNVDEEHCESLCDNADCNSLSYCRLERTCLISLLHRLEAIEPLTESAPFCAVATLDYLSRFEVSHRQIKPPEQVSKTLVAHSRHDCAVHCVEEAEFTCRAFYYCLNTTEQADAGSTAPNCFLQRELQLMRTDEMSIMPIELVPEDDAERNVSACYAYSRSYMTEFDKYYGKRLAIKPAESDARYVMVRPGLNAEGCSLECAHRFGQCFAFHVCYLIREPVCTMMLLDEAIIDELANRSQSHWIGLDPKTRLEDSSGCTTFTVAKGSRLRAALIANALMKDNTIQDKGEVADELLENELADQKVEPKGESFGAMLLMISLGMAIGYVAGFLYKKRLFGLLRA